MQFIKNYVQQSLVQAQDRTEQENMERYGVFCKGAFSALALRAAANTDVAGAIGWLVLFSLSDKIGQFTYRNHDKIQAFGESVLNDAVTYVKNKIADITVEPGRRKKFR